MKKNDPSQDKPRIIPIPRAQNLDLSNLISPNPGLLAQKFVEWESENSEKRESQESRKYSYTIRNTQLAIVGQSIHSQRIGAKGQFFTSSKGRINSILNEILKAYQEKYNGHFEKCGGELRTYELQSRLAIGLGSADVREIGFMFHRHGFPYIPGSALKGAARAAAELIDKASLEEIQTVFGWAPDPKQGLPDAHVGKVIFWDAIPLPGQKLLELDVMNPHFPNYYSSKGKNPPAEWDSPIPIYFLTVPAGTRFLFAIEADSSVQAQALRWLDIALTQLGIGAKTTLGYGLWKRVS
ncbi:MAG: type III-B CRISPR module RAMP protein Cmr6 [Bacteroidia bacterium]|nr:type III-B CRISPR module RAMP protein Cmr6 [Bacteroidia bacterium]